MLLQPNRTASDKGIWSVDALFDELITCVADAQEMIKMGDVPVVEVEAEAEPVAESKE